MNNVPFGDERCETTRRNLDSYLTNELAPVTHQEVMNHIGHCPACAAELEARLRLRTALKAAVGRQAVPPELRVRVRARLEQERSRGWWKAGWPRWAAATAAAAVICLSVWRLAPRETLPALADRPGQQAYIQKVSSTLAAVFKVGLGDHIHCSIFRKYPQNPPTVEQMKTKLGPAYQGLLPVVKAAVPEGYRVIMAHQCSYDGRKFVHLTLQNGGDLISLVVARKNPGESLGNLAMAQSAAGIPIYQSAAERYEVAAFEAGQFLAFVVSEKSGRANLRMATNLAPGVHDLLAKIAG
jgi:anti-sigma factor (TIGR02949 family)